MIYDDTGCRWGYQIDIPEERYKRFKNPVFSPRDKLSFNPLFLEDTFRSKDILKALDPFRFKHALNHWQGTQLITEYLKALRGHVDQLILESVGEAALKGITKEYIITIPSIWPYRITKLLTIAVEAGMGNIDSLHSIPEIEAATIGVTQDVNFCGLAVDDTVLICNIDEWYV